MLSWTKASYSSIRRRALGIFGFAVLANFRLVFWFFVSKNFGFSIFSILVCGFYVI